MAPNNCWPLRLPRRAFGGTPFTRVAYASSVLGPLGWLARWGKRGAIPLETRWLARAANDAFDHAEAWLRIDEAGRHLDDRILVGHPYSFDAKMREALTGAATAFDFAWSASPPGASWYAPNAWLVVAHPKHLLPIPAAEEIVEPRRGLVRRPLRAGEFSTDVGSAEEARRLAKRKYNRDRYEAEKNRPLSLGEILSDPARARARLRARE